jgi:hypothetical protein
MNKTKKYLMLFMLLMIGSCCIFYTKEVVYEFGFILLALFFALGLHSALPRLISQSFMVKYLGNRIYKDYDNAALASIIGEAYSENLKGIALNDITENEAKELISTLELLHSKMSSKKDTVLTLIVSVNSLILVALPFILNYFHSREFFHLEIGMTSFFAALLNLCIYARLLMVIYVTETAALIIKHIAYIKSVPSCTSLMMKVMKRVNVPYRLGEMESTIVFSIVLFYLSTCVVMFFSTTIQGLIVRLFSSIGF